jgi:hypothetical protein
MKLSFLLVAAVAGSAISPIKLVSQKCHFGCDATNGCSLFNGCGNAGYCGGRGGGDDHNANGIINGRGTTYTIASCSSGKNYEDVFDFGQLYLASAFNLVGSSAGHWCEDGKCPNGRAHNDNSFSAQFSANGVTWSEPQNVKYTEHFNNLGDGAGFTMDAIRMRYIKLKVTSGCWGCHNTDTVTKMLVDATPVSTAVLARDFFSPTSLVSSKCDAGCDASNGCPLFNGCGNARYCGRQGSAADDHDASGIVSGKGTTYTIAACSNDKKYTDVFDFGKTITATSYNLLGISAGHWCEDGKCPNGRAHNDNNFVIPQFSTDGVNWVSPKGVAYTEGFQNLGDGAGFVMDPMDMRYVKMIVSSGCWGCSNTDTVKKMLVGGVEKSNTKPHINGYRPVKVVSSKCDAGCDGSNGCSLFNNCGNANYCGRKGSAADDHDASGILTGVGATYTIARCSNDKKYTDVFDFGKTIAASALNLVGSSAGHWCEDGNCPNGRAHNDNRFSAQFSTDGVNWVEPKGTTFTEHFGNLGDGAGFTMQPVKTRYVKLTVASGCWGCHNTDTVTDLLLDGTPVDQVDTDAVELSSPISLVSSKCDAGCDASNGCPLFNGCGNARYCGRQGSAADDHDASGIVSGKGTTYTIAACSNDKTYTDVFDFGSVKVGSSLHLVGVSAGYWCEDGACNKERAHNDNQFQIDFSVDGKTWVSPKNRKVTDHFGNLGDGAGFTMDAMDVRYIKMTVRSGCWGCINTDTVKKIILGGPKRTAAPTAFPTPVPTASPTAYPTPVPTASPTAYPTPVPTASPTAFPTPSPTPVPTASPTASPTGILSHNVCKATTCIYQNGRTHVSTLTSAGEKWHCEKVGDNCRCVCHSSLQCALRHHHTSGYKKTFTHC